jgi:hypothetical protein
LDYCVGITVIDGEVIPVENIPHPPTLPEPPPFTIGFDYRIHRCTATIATTTTTTTIDGELILLDCIE